MRPRGVRLAGVEWRCIRCAARGIGLTVEDATRLVIEHSQKVHPEEGEA